MNQIVLSDELLKSAVELAHEKWISLFPAPEECGHEFPEGFYESILRDSKKLGRGKTIARRAAAIFIAVLIGAAVLMAANKNVRAAIISWVREITGARATYHFVSDSPLNEVPHYKLSYIPEGFEEVDEINNQVRRVLLYMNTETNQIIVFECKLLSEENYIQIQKKTDIVVEQININGIKADFYPADDFSLDNNLVWFDEGKQINFSISSGLEKSVIIDIAEGVVLDNSTK